MPTLMEEQILRLAEKAKSRYTSTPPDKRLLIAISGIPGSGKTTIATAVSRLLNAFEPIAAFVPMDGYHLTRAQLSALPNPTEAHTRRGAAFTFDAPAYLALVKALRAPLTSATTTVHAPSFSHVLKDPVADDIAIDPSHRIVIFEGNYLSLDEGEWKEAAELMDERWFVEADFDLARRRLVSRHVRTGVEANEKDARKRVDESDLRNGKEIVDGRGKVDDVVRSVEENGFKEGSKVA
ncbi:hypothetical protein MMC25_002094 [Agyrium rufum]|nr:hypothetical protein [Agyrium rufum]